MQKGISFEKARTPDAPCAADVDDAQAPAAQWQATAYSEQLLLNDI
jgi:hypothetical protein